MVLGRCLNIIIRHVCMDCEPCFKVHNLVSVRPKSIKLDQITSLNVIFHVVVSVYRFVKIWNSPQFPAQFRNGLWGPGYESFVQDHVIHWYARNARWNFPRGLKAWRTIKETRILWCNKQQHFSSTVKRPRANSATTKILLLVPEKFA